MIGYRCFMRNVKFNSSLLLLVVLYFLFPSNVFANGGNCRAWYHQIYTPPSMLTSDGFFDPKIRVCAAWAQCNDCWDVPPGYCGYMWPANVFVYDLWPDPAKRPCNSDCEGGCTDCSPEEPLICACQTFSCYLPWDPAQWAKSCMAGSELGCIKRPLAPGPPPFCNSFESDAEIRIIPVAFSDQSFFSPKIKTIITDVRSSTNKVFSVKFDKAEESAKQTISHEGVNYLFTTSKLGIESTCLNYYGSDTATPLMANRCFPSPLPEKPVVSRSASNPEMINIKFSNCDGSSYCSQDLAAGQDLIVGSGIKVIHPVIKDDHTFSLTLTCEDGSAVQNGKCQDSRAPISNYLSGSRGAGGAICLAGWPAYPAEYFVKRGGQHHWLKTFGKKLVRSAVLSPSSRPVKCTDAFSLSMGDLSQSKLDGMDPYAGGYYKFRDESKPIAPSSSNPCEESMSVYMYEESLYLDKEFTECEDVLVQEYGGKKHNFCVTRYYDEDSMQLFFQTKLEAESSALMARDPYNSNLCVDNFSRSNYLEVNKDQFFTANTSDKKCDFIKIEAWGGGGAASLDDSSPGGAGDYVMAVVRTVPLIEGEGFKINVGNGGLGSGAKGGDTTVHICSNYDDSSTCVPLLVAGGAGNNKENYDKAILKKDKLLQPRFKKGLSSSDFSLEDWKDIAISPYLDESRPDGYYGVDSCAKASNESVVPGGDNGAFPGFGGCVNPDKKVYQNGSDGKVVITCERW